MRAVRAFLLRLTGQFDKGRKDREMTEEFESHLQMQIEDNLRAGMSPEQARRKALLKSGGLETSKESCRHSRASAHGDGCPRLRPWPASGAKEPWLCGGGCPHVGAGYRR
jgi:hypothetical protein